jgi:hypothetical protein
VMPTYHCASRNSATRGPKIGSTIDHESRNLTGAGALYWVTALNQRNSSSGSRFYLIAWRISSTFA